MSRLDFESFLISRSDLIDSAAFDLACALSNSDEDELEWDMELIAEIVNSVKKLLTGRNRPVCHPFYEGDEEVPCYLGEDCVNPLCPLRKETTIK